MKFGDSLSKRSIPQWRSYNIDYTGIKRLIKENTTPGNSKAISIPGQSDTVAHEFALHLFDVLRNEHERISLFVKSKCYEINSRLTLVERQLNQVRRNKAGLQAQQAIVQAQRKLSRVESDILAVGEEIEKVSRFITINHLAIKKLLKKYRKWTGLTELQEKVQEELFDQASSFTKVTMKSALDQYTEYLDIVRRPFSARASISQSEALGSPPGMSLVDQDTPDPAGVSTDGTSLAFDTRLATSSKDRQQDTAVFWVHADNVIQLRVLLLQFMRYASFGDIRDGQQQSNQQSATNQSRNQREESVGVVVIDDANRFRSANSNYIPAGEQQKRVAATALWTTGDDVSVLVSGMEEYESTELSATLQKNSLYPFLADKAYDESRIEANGTINGNGQPETSKQDLQSLQSWLREHDSMQPICRVRRRRSRFVALDNTPDRGVFASLDESITMSTTSLKDLKNSGFFKPTNDAVEQFPHAVLTISTDRDAGDLLAALDHSHLTERVDAFSIEIQSIAACCRPAGMPRLPWASTLETDIRHIPTHAPPVALSRRTSASHSMIASQMPLKTSRSGASQSHSGPLSEDTTVQNGDTTRAKRHRRTNTRLPVIAQDRFEDRDPNIQKYWNEYDNGSEFGGDNEGFIVYVDPDAPLFPGQKILVRWSSNIKSFFQPDKPKSRSNRHRSSTNDLERQPLISSANASSDALAATNSTESSDDESLNHDTKKRSKLPWLGADRSGNAKIYGTLPGRSTNKYINVVAPQSPTSTPQVPIVCLAASLILLALLNVMAMTGRRKVREEIDIAVMLGVAAALVFAMVGGWGLIQSSTGRGFAPRAAWARRIGAGIAFAVICVWSGALLAWVLQ